MTPVQFVKKAVKANAIKTQLDQLNSELAEARTEILRTVKMTKKGETITLVLGDRVVKAKFNPRRYAYNLQENGQRLATEVRASIHDIRFSMAMGDL
jgi:hypothetical protein